MSATADTYVRARIDSDTKERAETALRAMGLSVSDAIRLLMIRVADEQQLPFAVKVPNGETRAAMAEADEMMRTRHLRFTGAQDMVDALEKEAGK